MGKINATDKADRSDILTVEDIAIENLWAQYYAKFLAFADVLADRLPAGTPFTLPTQQQAYGIFDGILDFSHNLKLYYAAPELHVVLKKHMAFTLMVPGGKALRAFEAIKLLDTIRFFGCEADWPFTVHDVYALIKPYVRFPSQKAERLWQVRTVWPDIVNTVTGGRNPVTCGAPPLQRLDYIRDWIIEHVDGMSNKAASHFMRNTGLFGLRKAYPIIDVHIYKVLKAMNANDSGYAYAEPAFEAIAAAIDIPVIILDASLWCAFSGNWDPNQLDFGNFKEQVHG